ncbi:MAG TPA: hypothetical protein VNF71_02620, partial [Acidimicrobiales bacterium]|nr:hypothetical protein [Acidimicrobiales bacterium]
MLHAAGATRCFGGSDPRLSASALLSLSAHELATDAFDAPTADQIAAVRARIRDAIKTGGGAVHKIFPQSLIDG